MAQPQKTSTKVVIIDPEGDLIVRLYENIKNGTTFIDASGNMVPGRILATYKVTRKVLTDNSVQFNRMLTGQFMEANQKVIDVKEGTVASLELWFRVLHNKMTNEMYAISIPDVWEAIEVCGYRQLDLDKLKGEAWFNKWLECKTLKTVTRDEMRMLLFPCHELNHATGFAYLTRRLAYEMAEHITEINPTKHRHLHLEPNVIGSINGAKGSLKGKLIRGLFDPVNAFLKLSCDCKEKSLFAYCTGLSKTGIWPLESHHKKSAREILNSPGFENFECTIPEGACVRCSLKLNPGSIEMTRWEIANHFDGLCLDCMDKSKPKTGDIDRDYWEHDIEEEWSAYCRINHKQATWYFSFMGRKADMKAHKDRKRRHWEDMNDRFGTFGFY